MELSIARRNPSNRSREASFKTMWLTLTAAQARWGKVRKKSSNANPGNARILLNARAAFNLLRDSSLLEPLLTPEWLGQVSA